MARQDNARARVVEHGNIYFLYRPKVDTHEPKGLDDVQRFFMALQPTRGSLIRLIALGRKRLPDVDDHERNWAFVEAIAKSGTRLEDSLREEDYETKTRGKRTRPAVRPAGEGAYILARRGREMQLGYALELPREPGPVQKALNIAPAASFVVSVKNPERSEGSPVRRDDDRQADYPKSMQKAFRGRRFAGEEPRLLDYEGAELVLVGVTTEPEQELDVAIDTEHETLRHADILERLRMKGSRHPLTALLDGDWG